MFAQILIIIISGNTFFVQYFQLIFFCVRFYSSYSILLMSCFLYPWHFFTIFFAFVHSFHSCHSWHSFSRRALTKVSRSKLRWMADEAMDTAGNMQGFGENGRPWRRNWGKLRDLDDWASKLGGAAASWETDSLGPRSILILVLFPLL